jgi:hypothetical protein
METISDLSLRSAQTLGSKARLPEPLLKRAAMERIATGLSLISQAVGFSIIGILILATCDNRRHQRSFREHRVPFRRSSVMGLLRQAFSWFGAQPQDCPPNVRETRINRSTSFPSLRPIDADGENYGDSQIKKTESGERL